MGDYWKKGDKDPDAGKPHRHTRDKIRLMLDDADCEKMHEVIWKIADKYPVEVLTALVGDDD